jgi:uncharacterized protein (UPF0261 family)
VVTVVLLGAPTAEGAEYAWLMDRVRVGGCEPVALDGASAADVLVKLHEQGRLHGVLAIGGPTGGSPAFAALRALPIGVPKLVVTARDHDTHGGITDVTTMHSVVDIVGIDQVSERILDNAAAAITGMARSYHAGRHNPTRHHRPLVATTVPATRPRLEHWGYAVVVVPDSRPLPSLVDSGFLAGVISTDPSAAYAVPHVVCDDAAFATEAADDLHHIITGSP